MLNAKINTRYSTLAESNCSLSCGNALKFTDPQEGDVCVDLGSGKGGDVLRMAEKVGVKGHVFGIDIADGMIEKARATANKQGIGNVTFIQCELEKINLADAVADLVTSNCTLNHSSNKQKVWNEISRILKAGGRFVISDIYSTNKIPDIYKNDPVAVAECWAGAVTKDEYLLQIKNAGFINVEILEESSPYKKREAELVSLTITGQKSHVTI